MPIDAAKLKAWPFPVVEQTYTARDTMLYALGLGLGSDPLSSEQLRYVYEQDLCTMPTMATVLATPGPWIKNSDTGITWQKVVAAGVDLTIHQSLPASGTVTSCAAVTQIYDKGAAKGAILLHSRDLTCKSTGQLLATVNGTSFLRGDGGFGGPDAPAVEQEPIPSRDPDLSCTIATLPQQALIYRLSGDYIPLHADPEFAKKNGFPRPILHGLCTFGMAASQAVHGLCGADPQRLRRIAARFVSPVFPGETLRVDFWRVGNNRANFRVVVPERDVVALGNGLVEHDGR